MATDLAHEILKQMQKLSPDEQLQVLDDVRRRSELRSPLPATHSILELEGLGREIWNGLDAQDYVRRERDSWNG